MMPTDIYQPKEPNQTSSLPSSAQKSERALPPKEAEGERKVLQRPAETPRAKDIDQVETSTPAKGNLEASPPQMKAEARKEEVSSPKSEIISHQAFDLREQARPKVTSSGPEKAGKGVVAKEKSGVTLKPPQEIVLRISDREKVVSRLQELVKEFGGEVVATEGNIFVASLPTGSFPDFQKEVTALGSSPKEDKLVQKKQALGSLRAAPGVRREDAPKPAADAEGRLTIRILLVQE
jgi:hypothetical protein